MGHSWELAKWSLRAAEWVVRRAGLALVDVPTEAQTPAGVATPVNVEMGNGGQVEAEQGPVNGVQGYDPLFFDPAGFSFDDDFPMLEFLGEHLWSQ